MKKYISILLAVVLSASLLAGCGGGSGNSEQKPATEAKEDTDANTNPAAGFYQIYVIDAATLDPIEGARVQFCSDSACMMGITDSSGLASFESDPGTRELIPCTYSKPPRVIRTARRSSRSRRIHAKRHTSWKKSKPEQKLQRIPQTVKTVMTRSFRLNGTVRIQDSLFQFPKTLRI